MNAQRKGMQVVIPDAESFRLKARPAVEERFKKERSVTTRQEVLAYQATPHDLIGVSPRLVSESSGGVG